MENLSTGSAHVPEDEEISVDCFEKIGIFFTLFV